MSPHKCVITVSLIALVILCMAGQTGWAQTQGRPDLVFAYSAMTLPDIDVKDSTAALKVWVKELGKDLGHIVDAYVFYSLDEIVRDLDKGNVDFVAMSALDYLRIKATGNTELVMSHVRRGVSTQKYLLLTKTGTPFTKIGDLKNKKVAVLKNDQTALFFLNTLLLRQNLPEASSFFSEVQEKTKPSQVVLAVFFGQVDACIITDTTLNTMIELNPQVQKGLNTVASSPDLVDAVMIVRKTYREDFKEKALKVTKDLNKTTRGKQILTLFKVDGFTQATESSLESIRGLVAEHDRLKKQQSQHAARGR